tara:strand:- start:2648 stop:2926 length:279 start_codon:yes stop_codon:yes gene_type:complete
MPVKTYAYTLETGIRQLVVPADVEPQGVSLHNHEHALSREIFVGNSEVTANNGMHAVATETSIITLPAGDELYAISEESADVELRIMVVTRH